MYSDRRRFATANPRRPLLAAIALAAFPLTFAAGCNSGRRAATAAPASEVALTQPTTAESALSPSVWVPSVLSQCRPPRGWLPQPAGKQEGSEHELWISPSGATAYGVVVVKHWLMALATNEKILAEFLKNMKASDGKADLLAKTPDPELANGVGGIRFEAAGGKYTLRAYLVSSGNRAWFVYAGTLNAMPVDQEQLKVAETARELTVTEPAGGVP